jgi:stage II sporulation protein D
MRQSTLLSIFLPGLFLALLLIPFGCSQDNSSQPIAATSPRIRVLLVEDADRVELTAGGTAIKLDSRPLSIQFPGVIDVPTSLAGDGWHLGRQIVRPGILTLTPTGAPISVNGVAYRGNVRLVPVGAGRFNVINDIDVEDYLAGVVTREMYATWPLEAIKAQAVASRTYALYETHSAGINRPWDVFGDQRSQMYGGIPGESPKSRLAVSQTQGIVLTYGPGDGVIFKAYFSSCCGGVTQAAADAFPGEPYIPPLAEKSNGSCCNASKYFNWGPITISKSELTRRFHVWAQRQSHEMGRPIAEQNMAAVYRIDLQQVNRYGRPNRILITDSHGVQFSWPAEQLRTAVNTDAQSGPTLPSSFCKINSDPNSPTVTFYEGHGFGHGVGMCQWCAEARAAAGQNFEQILVDAYPQAKLVPAY